MKIGVIGGENLVPLGKIRVRDSTFNTFGVVQLKEPGNHRILRWLFTLKSFGLDTSLENIAATRLISMDNRLLPIDYWLLVTDYCKLITEN